MFNRPHPCGRNADLADKTPRHDILFWLMKTILSFFVFLIPSVTYSEAFVKSHKIHAWPKCFQLAFSQIALNYKGQAVNIPIYGGMKMPIKYEELYTRHIPEDEKQTSILAHLCVPAGNNPIVTYQALLEFYSENLLKNAKPALVWCESYRSRAHTHFDVIYEGIPIGFHIEFPAKCTKDLELNEITPELISNKTKIIVWQILVGRDSNAAHIRKVWKFNQREK